MDAKTPHGKFVSSEDVEGTDVYSSREREKIGTIHHLVIDKPSGRVAYADMSFGGFLGMGESHHQIPWQALHYDTSLDGFVTGITIDQLKDAPEFGASDIVDRRDEDRLHRHYQVPGYWTTPL